jgi:uncharacterized protein (DUF983 family)
MAAIAGQVGNGIGIIAAFVLYGFVGLVLACPKCGHQLFLRNGIWYPWPLKICEQCGHNTDQRIAQRDV